jgi:hypothetical protein
MEKKEFGIKPVELFPGIYGAVEIIHKKANGKIDIQWSNNMIVRGANTSSGTGSPYNSGENLLAYFLSKSNSAKYDAEQGSAQTGYFDFMAIGRGFMLGAAGDSSTIFTIPNSPQGGSEVVDFFCNIPSADGGVGLNVTSHFGLNSGETKVSHATVNYAQATQKITLASGFSNTPAQYDIVMTDPSNREVRLQGEPDSGGSFKDRNADGAAVTNYSRKTVTKTLGATAISKNQVTFSATWDGTASDTCKLTIGEAGIFNVSAIPVGQLYANRSGDMFARVVFTPIAKAAGDIITFNWKFIMGYQRTV